MYLGSSDQQAQSVGSVLGNRLNAYQSLQASLSQFIHDSASLSGHTYDSAKAYSQQILHPLIKGCILLDEAVNTACSKLPSQYRSQVDQVDLKEDELMEQIYRADLFISRYMELIALEYRQDQPSYSYISSLRSSEDRYRSLKQKLEEKLQKLRAFDGSSVYLFSNIQPLIAAVQAGMRQATSSWNAETKVFTLPPAKDMEWVKQVDERWESKKEKEETEAYNAAVKKAENGQVLADEDMQAVYTYARSHPDELLSQALLASIKNFVDKSKDLYDRSSTQLDVAATITEQLGLGVQRLGGLITILEGIKGPATTNVQGLSTTFIVVNKGGIGQALVQHGTKTAAVGKGLGYGLMGVGFGLGMYDDIVNQDKTWGQALVHNGLSTGIGWGAGVGATAAISAIFFVSNPIGWAAAGVAAASLAVGTVVSLGFETAYNNNFLGLQDGLDTVGDWLDDAGKDVGTAVSNSIEGVKNWIEDLTDDVGKAFSSGLSILTPFD
ncbi:hypothetical protein BU200_02810 [Streptococcus acidominimus]|nr:hypothetical protein BU200_02810 [Streptococcus acidominimus]